MEKSHRQAGQRRQNRTRLTRLKNSFKGKSWPLKLIDLTPTQRVSGSGFFEFNEKEAREEVGKTKKKTGGRNCYGRITARAIGGGHKQKIRTVDFRRNKTGIEAEVIALEYDPMRSARLALLQYTDGEKRYIVAPVGLKVGDKVMSGDQAPASVGNAMPLSCVPAGSSVYSIELTLDEVARSLDPPEASLP